MKKTIEYLEKALESHKMSRESFKNLKKEQKEKGISKTDVDYFDWDSTIKESNDLIKDMKETVSYLKNVDAHVEYEMNKLRPILKKMEEEKNKKQEDIKKCQGH